MGLLGRDEGNPSMGVNLIQIRVEGFVSAVKHLIGVTRTQFIKTRVKILRWLSSACKPTYGGEINFFRTWLTNYFKLV